LTTDFPVLQQIRRSTKL